MSIVQEASPRTLGGKGDIFVIRLFSPQELILKY